MTLSLRALALTLASAAGALALACKAGPPPPACPATFKELPADQQSSLFVSCTCPANAGAASGSVWGAGVYTTDSNICKAAVHTGALSSSGGTVTVKKSVGCGSYTGTVANGVTTQAWGAFDSSFFFSGYGTGACAGSSPGMSGAPMRTAPSAQPPAGPSGSVRPAPSSSARLR